MRVWPLPPPGQLTLVDELEQACTDLEDDRSQDAGEPLGAGDGLDGPVCEKPFSMVRKDSS